LLTRSRIIDDASQLAGGPNNSPVPDGVPESLRFILAADLETEMIRDLNQSPEDHLVSSVPIQLNYQQQDFIVPGSNVESPCYVSVKVIDPPVWWPNTSDVEITNLSQLTQNFRERRIACAFYDQRPIKGKVSWLPLGTETLTVWYDRSPITDPSPDQATFTITDSYVPLLKLLLAAQMMEMTGKPIGAFLMSRIDRGMKQWEKYVKRNRQPGTVTKASWIDSRRRSGGYYPNEFLVR
jgi:hypothetical protein